MRRYFFDYRNGDKLSPDTEGIVLAGLKAVQDEAARALSDWARDELLVADGSVRHLTIEVRNTDGAVMHAKFSFEIEHL